MLIEIKFWLRRAALTEKARFPHRRVRRVACVSLVMHRSPGGYRRARWPDNWNPSLKFLSRLHWSVVSRRPPASFLNRICKAGGQGENGFHKIYSDQIGPPVRARLADYGYSLIRVALFSDLRRSHNEGIC